jgi:small subunit ribosomal protein S16
MVLLNLRNVMVVIRLVRTGSKKRPFYQIVAADKRFPLNGRYIQSLGYYNPIAKGQEKTIHIDIDAVEAFISKGAQCSDRFISVLKAYDKSLVANGQPGISSKFASLSKPDSQKQNAKKSKDSATTTKKEKKEAKPATAKKPAAAKKAAPVKKATAKKKAD